MNQISRRSALALGGSLALSSTLPRFGRAADLGNVTLRVGDQTGQTQQLFQQAGLLEHVPYKIEWSVFAAAVNLHEALKAGAIDTGLAGDAPTISAIAGGSPIQVVAAWGNGGAGVDLLLPAGSKIKSVADLKGKTVSPTTRGSIGQFLLLKALKKAGLTQDDLKLAFLAPTDATAAFGAGSIDAWAIWGIYDYHAQGALKARVLAPGSGLISGLFVMPAAKAAIADPGKRAALADYADRVEAAYHWSVGHRDESIAWFQKFARQDKETATFNYESNIKYHRVPADQQLTATLQDVYQTWVDGGVFKGALDIAPFVYHGLKVGSA